MTDRPENDPNRDARAAELADPRPRNRSHWWLWLLLLVVVVLAWWWYSQRSVEPEPALPPVDVTEPTAEDAGAGAGEAEQPAAEPEPATPAPEPDVTPEMVPASPLAGQNPAPTYPAEALRVGEGGTVVLRVEVAADGTPANIEFARRSGSRELDRAAREAVRQWRFNPATRNGEPVASTIEVPVEFNPQG